MPPSIAATLRRPAVASREQLAKDREAKAAADRERIAAAATAAKRELQAKLGGGKGAASQQHQQQQQQHQAAAAQERTLDDFEKARAAKQSAKVLDAGLGQKIFLSMHSLYCCGIILMASIGLCQN